jgi:hypothetical protein
MFHFAWFVFIFHVLQFSRSAALPYMFVVCVLMFALYILCRSAFCVTYDRPHSV